MENVKEMRLKELRRDLEETLKAQETDNTPWRKDLYVERKFILEQLIEHYEKEVRLELLSESLK